MAADRFGVGQPPGSALPAGVLSFASPKESSQRKGDPWVGAPLRGVPCATRAVGRLAKLAYGSNNASRHLPTPLRCSAPPKGIGQASLLKGSAVSGFSAVNAAQVPELASMVAVPAGLSPSCERRRATQGLVGKGRGLSEARRAEFRSPRQGRVAQGTPVGGADPGCRFSLATFFLGTQKESKPAGRAEHSASAKQTV